MDLDVLPTGQLSLDPGVTLRVLGRIRYGANLLLGAGSHLLIDAPAGALYDMELRADAQIGTLVVVRGAPGNPGVLDLNAGAGTGVLAPTFAAGNGMLDFEHGILRGGDAANPNRLWIRSGDHFRLVDSRVENSGGIIQHVDPPRGARITVENTTFIGTTGPLSIKLVRWNDPSTPGTTVYRHSVFDKQAWIEGPDALIDGCFFENGYESSPGETVFYRVIENSLVRRAQQSPLRINGDYRGNIHLEHHTEPNPHALLVDLKSPGSVVEGNVFKYTGGSSAGDMIQPRSGNPAPIHLEVIGNLVLPNGDGSGPSGTLVSMLGDPGWTVSVERNTYVVRGASGGIAIAEQYAGHAGMLTRANSNLAVGIGGAGAVMHQIITPAAGYVTEARANGYWNIGTLPYQVTGSAFASSPGAGDVEADPQFVDASRDLASYDAAVGGPGTVAHLLAEVARMNDPDFNPAYTPAVIRDWIRDGWRPMNGAFHGSGDGGVDIGAVPR